MTPGNSANPATPTEADDVPKLPDGVGLTVRSLWLGVGLAGDVCRALAVRSSNTAAGTSGIHSPRQDNGECIPDVPLNKPRPHSTVRGSGFARTQKTRSGKTRAGC